MMVNRSCHQNPVLEIKRNAYLSAEKEFRDDLVGLYEISVSKTKHIHASLLFTTHNGYSILKGICRLVTHVDSSINNTNWRDLAVKLGYTDLDVKCINNLRGNIFDPTEQVLKYFASTKKAATVGKILEALLELGFLPAVHQAQKHIDAFLAEIETGKTNNIIETVLDNQELETKSLLKAADFKPLVPAIFDSLPCKNSAVEFVNYSLNTNKEVDTFQRASPKYFTGQNHNKQYCKYVMLSFASDGYTTALKVASALRATTNKKGFPIGVLMLCKNDNIIQGNPGQIIPDMLTKMDFVIPILTEGYFAALKQPNPQAKLLDERYIQFIHGILVTKYILNNCLNLQVRPVIPSQIVDLIHKKEEFIHNTLFSAWKSDNELCTLAKNILKSNKRKTLPF